MVRCANPETHSQMRKSRRKKSAALLRHRPFLDQLHIAKKHKSLMKQMEKKHFQTQRAHRLSFIALNAMKDCVYTQKDSTWNSKKKNKIDYIYTIWLRSSHMYIYVCTDSGSTERWRSGPLRQHTCAWPTVCVLQSFIHHTYTCSMLVSTNS